MDLRPSIEAALAAFALEAVMTPPGGPAVEARAIWLPSTTVEYPTGSEYRRAEMRRVIALTLDGVSLIPRDTIVTAPEYSGAVAVDWKVDESERVDFDHWRVVVVPA